MLLSARMTVDHAFSRTLLALGLVSSLTLLASCTQEVQRRDWSTYTGPGAEHFQKAEVDPLDFTDPIEPFNRVSNGFNNAFVGAIKPVAHGYRVIVPKPLRDAVTRFGRNLLYPRRVLANLLQKHYEQAGNETKRFLLNSTVGVLGLFDVAKTRWGIEPSEEDFGQVLAWAGWQNSRYVCLPLYGPSTGRDTVGLVPDTVTDPASYYFPTRPILSFNEAAEYVDSFVRFARTTYDTYALLRLYWLLNRNRSITNYKFDEESGPAVQTLQALFLTYREPTFPEKLHRRRVHLGATGKELPYTYLLQPGGAAPIVFILPGMGAHRESTQALAIAELVYRNGYSFAIISSAFNWEFMRNASTAAVPGHGPADAHDSHIALDAVAGDLELRYPGRLGSRALLGYSMGAFHAFYIAAEEQDRDSALIKFDRFVTLDAPVRLAHGAKQLDAFFNTPLLFPDEERAGRMRAILSKGLQLGRGQFQPDRPIPFTETEARFLVGLSFRLTLQSVIYDSQERQDMGVLLTERHVLSRGAAYEEIFDYSMMEYAYAFVIPYYLERNPEIGGPEEVFALNDLRSIEGALRRSGKIRHVANHDDFLISEDDIRWLTQTLGEANTTFLPRGGHLGNLFKPEVQQQVLRALEIP